MGFKLFETTFDHCPTGESSTEQHERHTSVSHSTKPRRGQRAMAARLARTPADLGSHVGNCLCRTLCGSVLRLRRLSDRLRVMDGPRPVALCTRRLRPALHEDGDQYPALRGPRRERENVFGLAAVRLLHAPPAVDQGPADHLYSALGAAGSSCLSFLPLDAYRRAGSS